MSDSTDNSTCQLAIKGMSCASCVRHIERALQRVPGVSEVSVNLANESAQVSGSSLQIDALIKAVEDAGYHASERAAAKKSDAAQALVPERKRFLLAAVLTTPLVLPMVLQLFGVHWMLPAPWQCLLATIVLFGCGQQFLRGAVNALRVRTATMDTLVSVGTLSAWLLSLVQWQLGTSAHELYFESAAVIITLILLGKWLEANARHRTTAAIRALTALRPDTVCVLREGVETVIALDQLHKGAVMVVKPGERIATDGVITNGSSQLDESMLSGEATPVLREPGAKVYGGALNLDGRLLITVTALGAETLLANIVRLVETAQGSKPAVQRLADRISAVMVPIVIGIALLTWLAWMLISGDWNVATLNAVSVLVIACPCALGLATPAALIAGIGVAARHGILIRDAEALERAQALTHVAFDKTGTLTQGKPRLVTLKALALDEQTTLTLAGALQKGSTHPLATAVLNAVMQQQLTLPAAEAITSLAGRGMTALIAGHRHWFGNQRLLEELGVSAALLQQTAHDSGAEGFTTSWLVREGEQGKELLALLLFQDQVRTTSAAAIAQLHAMQLHTLMLSGDNLASASAIAQQLGVNEVKAEILPADKATLIAQLQQQGARVAMVGDGINDAPALAQADVGIAMGGGTDVALQTAGITLMHSDPLKVVTAIAISRQTWRKLKQNLFWAFAYNLVGIPLAALGLLNPMLAGAMMAFSSVSVVSNAVLLSRWKPPAVAAQRIGYTAVTSNHAVSP